MPRFLVDDHFHDHPKRRKAGLEAIGLWTSAGSWCQDNLTDGFVPAYVAERWAGRRLKVLAERLVTAGLWDPALDSDGEHGWQFHDWSGDDGWQESAGYVKDRRKANAARQRRFRQRSNTDEQPPPPEAINNGRNALHNALRNGATNGVTNGVSNAPHARASSPHLTSPTNPLLTLAGRLTQVGPSEMAAGLPTEVVEEWQRVAGPGVDLEDEARAYLARHGDTTPNDPRGAWLGWLRKARTRYEADYGPPKPTCTTGCADGWLPSDDDARPCPTCKPHLRPVQGVAL